MCAHLNYIVYKTALKMHEEEAWPLARMRCRFPMLRWEGIYNILRGLRSIKTLLSVLYPKRNCLWVTAHRVWEARDLFQTVTCVIANFMVCLRKTFPENSFSCFFLYFLLSLFEENSLAFLQEQHTFLSNLMLTSRELVWELPIGVFN